MLFLFFFLLDFVKWSVSPFWNNNSSHDHNDYLDEINDNWSDHDFECFVKSILSRARNIFLYHDVWVRPNPIQIFLWAGKNFGLLHDAGVTSKTSNLRLFSSNFKAILRGSSFCTFGGVLYKTKILAKFVEIHKYYRSPLLLQARIMFDLFSSDFKTILKGSSFCTHPSTAWVLGSSVFGLLFLPTREWSAKLIGG